MQPIGHTPVMRLVEVLVTDPLDIDAVPRVRALLDDAAALRPADLVVDMTACAYVDAAGIGVLLDVHRRVWSDGGRLTLRGLSPKVARTLELARVDRVLHVTAGSAAPPVASSWNCHVFAGRPPSHVRKVEACPHRPIGAHD